MKRYKFQWCQFIHHFVLWIITFPINAVPILFKHIEPLTAENFPGIAPLITIVVGDIDFLYLGISAAFVLSIECSLCKKDYTPRHLIPFCNTFLLLSFFPYATFSLKPDLFTLFSPTAAMTYNLFSIGLLLLLGLIYNANISVAYAEGV